MDHELSCNSNDNTFHNNENSCCQNPPKNQLIFMRAFRLYVRRLGRGLKTRNLEGGAGPHKLRQHWNDEDDENGNSLIIQTATLEDDGDAENLQAGKSDPIFQVKKKLFLIRKSQHKSLDRRRSQSTG